MTENHAEGDTFRALINFLLEAEEPIAFLRLWNGGSFDICRKEWPEAPDGVYPAPAAVAVPEDLKARCAAPPAPAVAVPDDFRGDTATLVRNIIALLELDAEGALVPHGVGGHARGLLSAAAARLAVAPAQAVAVPVGLDGVHVGRLPTMNQDEYPGLGDWWVQLRVGKDKNEVLARVYGNSPEQAHSRAAALAAPAQAVAVPADAVAAALIRLDAIYQAEADDGEFKPRPDWLVMALRLAAPPAQEHATQLAGQGQEDCAVLDGDWRRRMLDGSAIARDEMGCGEHPALPVLEEGMKPKQFFDALGIDLAGVMAEDQMDMDAYDAMVEATDYNVWTPEAPAGDGWVLVAIFDTEDGPAAWWMRQAAPEQPARKNRKAAPIQAQEDARDALLEHVVTTARAALEESTDAGNYFAMECHLVAALSLAMDELDAARAAQGGAA